MSSSPRLNSTRTPQQHSDFIGNLLELPRYQHGGDLAAERNPYQAFGEGLGAGQEFADPSSTTFELTLTSDAIDVSQLVLPAVSIHFAAEGDDRWIFDYSLIFTFVDETGQVIHRHFSSVRDGLPRRHPRQGEPRSLPDPVGGVRHAARAGPAGDQRRPVPGDARSRHARQG